MKLAILLSGGIDSTVLLASHCQLGDECLAISFDYGQTHRRELDAAMAIARHYRVQHEIVTIADNILRGSAVAEGDAIVPARNLVMLSTAVAVTDRWGGTAVAFGANNDDINGFPDCKPEFIAALDEAVYRSGLVCRSVIAPLVQLTKSEVIALGKQLDAPLHLTWSCYRGGQEPCRDCGACKLREEL